MALSHLWPHTRHVRGDPAHRPTIDVRAAVFYRFDRDRMTNETLCFDAATQMRQLGFDSMPL